MPFDGHFLPLTGIAHHLRINGHDVRFYTGPSYAARLAGLDVAHLPFRRATEVNGENVAEYFPEIEKLKGPKRIAFDLEKIPPADVTTSAPHASAPRRLRPHRDARNTFDRSMVSERTMGLIAS